MNVYIECYFYLKLDISNIRVMQTDAILPWTDSIQQDVVVPCLKEAVGWWHRETTGKSGGMFMKYIKTGGCGWIMHNAMHTGGRVMRLHFHFADKFASKSWLPAPRRDGSLSELLNPSLLSSKQGKEGWSVENYFWRKYFMVTEYHFRPYYIVGLVHVTISSWVSIWFFPILEIYSAFLIIISNSEKRYLNLQSHQQL